MPAGVTSLLAESNMTTEIPRYLASVAISMHRRSVRCCGRIEASPFGLVLRGVGGTLARSGGAVHGDDGGVRRCQVSGVGCQEVSGVRVGVREKAMLVRG